ncbi:NUDIX hydrolase [Streptomyces sp. NPDC015127]|uniref:nucleotide triphosphate diphosphatase NUDT15 n=1 Tax=Streptomyces sp. NPDC015127 TaxID=3364939 RepID=UPI0036FA1391
MSGGPQSVERPERAFPTPNGLVGVGVVVLDARSADLREQPDGDAAPALRGRVLLGLGHDGVWELPGGKVDPGESFEEAAVRELAEETGLRADAEGVRIGAVLVDGTRGVTRVTAAALVAAASGAAEVREPDKIAGWEWWPLDALPEPLFAPSAAVLDSSRPPPGLRDKAFHGYPVGRDRSRD